MTLRPPFVRTVVLTLVLSLGILPGCAGSASAQHVRQDPQSGRVVPDPGNVSMSPEQQIELGRKAAAEVAQQLPVLPENDPVTRYVQQLGQRLASKAPGYKWPYTFRVVNQKEINAFALPGGPIFINVGTIQRADEAELAGVMAHEISHVVMQHSARQAGKSQGIQMLGALGTVLAGAVLGQGMAGQLAQLGIQIGAAGVVTKYSREAETEADLVGAQIMYDAGLDPYSMVEFFNVLAQEGGGGGPQFLSSHPNPGNRAQNVAKAVQKFPKKQFPRSDSREFAAIKPKVDAMRPPSAEEIAKRQKQSGGAQIPVSRDGVGDVMPAGGMRELNQGGFRISYPSNWEAMGDRSGGSIVIAPPAGVSQNAIAYGVSIDAAQAASGRASIDSLTSQIVQQLQQTNPDMRPVSNPQRIRVNGRDGRSLDLISSSPLQSRDGASVRERDWLVTVKRDNASALVLVFIAPEPDFDRLRPTFEEMLRSLQMQ